MSELKQLSKNAIPGALEKAERYRLLNEPAEAESICLDVLAAEPENQQALIMLLLAVTDRFSKSYGVSDTQARQILRQIRVRACLLQRDPGGAPGQSAARARGAWLWSSGLRGIP